MFKRLLVPLDGSQLAEAVLPPAAFLAERLHATIILFHAVEQDAPATVHGQHHLLTAVEAEIYISGLGTRLVQQGLTVETNVHPFKETDVTRSIIEHVSELNADLIVLCAHGRGGLRDVFVGSIAQKVIQLGTTPVFFVRPEVTSPDAPYTCRKILVPLDGTAIHEPALPIATEIAQACDASLRLLTIVPTSGTLSAERAATGLLLPTTMVALLDLAQRGAVEYLESVTTRLLTEGIPATAQVARGDTAPAIVEIAAREQADLIVMATHGRGSVDAFWSGSVTPKVLAKAPAPVLLVRVHGEEAPR